MSYISFLSWVPKQDSQIPNVPNWITKRQPSPIWITAKYGALPSREQLAGSLEAQLRAGKSTCTDMPLSDHLTEPRLLQDSDGNLVPAAEITGPSGSPRQPRVYEDEAHEDTPRIKCPVAGCLATFVNRGNLAIHKSTKHPGITHIVS